jgi:hypothetical protein
LVRLPTQPVAKSQADQRLSGDEKEVRMPHNDVLQVLNDPLAQELLRSNIPARLAYTGRDGAPRAIPIAFHWDGTQFVVCTPPRAAKVRALEANPQVALTIDTNTFPPHVLLVRGTARIEVVDGVPPRVPRRVQEDRRRSAVPGL